MLYKTGQDYLNAPQKSIALFGMSGLGKTYLSNMLRDTGAWFHYSVDFRIGTRYMEEAISDNFKREAMKNPFLRAHLMKDSLYIGSNLSFHNLQPLSEYLGKPGDITKGGIPFETYKARQAEHRFAETAATADAGHFRTRSIEIYGYPHFICDCSGSLCEVFDDENTDVMGALSQVALPVWLKGNEADKNALIARFTKAPKPMYYQPEFLDAKWQEYLETHEVAPENVDPDDFITWGYRALIDARLPRYEQIAKNWGITLAAEDAALCQTESEFNILIAKAIDDAH